MELWSYEKCFSYFRRLESYTPGCDPRDAINAEKDTNCMNSQSTTNGPVKMTSGRINNRLYLKSPISPAFIRAAMQAGHKYNPNYNGATLEGVGWMDANMSNGIDSRHRAAICFRRSLKRTSLFFSNAMVSQILLQNKRAGGVENIIRTA